MRLRIDLAYDGTDFRGWATQPGLRTVQAELTSALAVVLRTDDPVSVVCAGRTDAGVHARGQVAHTDLTDELAARTDLGRLASRLNGVLPADVRVRRVVTAAPGFDARYAALWRRYAYRVADGPEAVDPLARHHVLVWRQGLDLVAMERAATHLLGLHDFASFCKRREGATTVRTLLDLRWSRGETGLATLEVRADAFCHSMVRSLVGCLLAVGDGRRDPDWAAEVLGARTRLPTLTVAPAHGLTLEEVAYPDDAGLAARTQATRATREVPA